MQATLRQLEELGAVERRTLPGRGRAAQLHVTVGGAELLRGGRETVYTADERLVADIPADQHEALASLLLQAFGAAMRRRNANTETQRSP